MIMVKKLTDRQKNTIERTRFLRKKSGLSQDQIAKLMGMTRDAYSKYETRSVITSRNVPLFCEALGISEAFLFSNIPENTPPQAPSLQAAEAMTAEDIRKLVYESALEAREVEAHLAKRKLKFAPTEFAKLAADRARIALLIRAENPGEDKQWVKSATHAAFDNVVRNLKFGS